jgi:mannose/fructose/N-acetylgalactosamine-specific phosphotransferase system component IIC
VGPISPEGHVATAPNIFTMLSTVFCIAAAIRYDSQAACLRLPAASALQICAGLWRAKLRDVSTFFYLRVREKYIKKANEEYEKTLPHNRRLAPMKKKEEIGKMLKGLQTEV